ELPPRLRLRRRRRPAGHGLPARRVHGAGVLPGHPARQADPRRGARGRGQDGAGEGHGRVPRPRPRAPAVLRGARRGQGALRVELPQAAPAHPGRIGRRGVAGGPGRHLRPGVPALAAAAAGHLRRPSRRPAHRRDRQDRPGVRGDAPRAPLGLPDLHPRARDGAVDLAPRGAADLEQHARAHRGAQAPLPLPVARLPLARPRAGDRPPAHARAPGHRRAQARRARGPRPRPGPQEAAEHRRVDRLGARAPAPGRPGHRPGDLPPDHVGDRQAPHGPRRRRRARRREAHPRCPGRL
ncbi:MAG: Carbon monoxide oxidation accessory protein CoxD, partial [uncultured Solirubrobacteraceae bacterium]